MSENKDMKEKKTKELTAAEMDDIAGGIEITIDKDTISKYTKQLMDLYTKHRDETQDGKTDS